MNLAVAVPFGVASAVVYGTSIVVQHRVAQEHADEGEESAKGLMRLARHPIFLLAIAGDLVGFIFNIVALSAGAVVLIQPLVVLMLPVALGVSVLMGGPKPTRTSYLGCVGVLGGLGAFLALIGEPTTEHVPRPHYILMAVIAVLLIGGLLVLLASRCRRIIRGAVYGAVAGSYFGTLAVMVDAASDRVSAQGVGALFTTPRGMVPLISVVVLGAAGMALTQLSFQVGALGATLPANLAADPAMGVIFGAMLLQEHVPLSVPHLAGYLLCLAAVVAGAIALAQARARLAEPATAAC
ncbi:DMT family transporter [uncultured Jatrophihabitans sp.]|uniref:DMT family transporter n=1 Tax=uncultured Jatrophihabitans sp. TaxID=1610747 RepID=UPI0035CB5AEF